jgi:hypothetical protein
MKGNGCMTKGEYRVGVDVNPSRSEDVEVIKHKVADLIDIIEQLPAGDGEVIRLKALARTAIEEGARWAVKAATKKPQEG